ncbi:MAG TPA: mucoidy inhibitor MuiA family protein, partial [Candidatus Goldiibacteriota bacterium]|nr:mucoidy inhibitor MuiA family protein [Candidatus Goldiibacteriota bacterium]
SMSDVTVYQGKAIVEKKASVDLLAGENLFTVKGLPSDIMENTLVVFKADKSAPYLIKEYEYRDVEADALLAEAERKLRQRLEAMQDELKAKDDRLSLLDTKLKYYRDLSAKNASEASASMAQKEVSVKNLSDVLVFAATGIEAAQKEKRRIEKEKAVLLDEIKKVQSELSGGNSSTISPQKLLNIRLAARSPVRAEVRLKYMTQNAGWYPAYEADYNTDKGTIDGKYYAMVYQSTLENWLSTRLTIATGVPMPDVTLPVPNPWIIREREYAAYRAAGAKSLKAAAPMAMEAASADMAAEQPRPQAIEQVISGELDVRAVLSGRFDILNNGTIKRAPITDIKLKRRDVFYTAVPSQNQAAYLTVEFENNDDLVMVPGEVSLYMDGNYTGKSYLSDRVRKGEALKFSFGIDENIKVKREKLQEKKGESGIFGSERRVDFGYRLSLENYKQRDITVYIKEPMPFSENDRIKAEMYETNNKNFTDEEHGIRVWRIELKPGEKTEINYRVKVVFPKDMNVQGI